VNPRPSPQRNSRRVRPQKDVGVIGGFLSIVVGGFPQATHLGTPTVAILVIVSVGTIKSISSRNFLELISAVFMIGHRYPTKAEGSKGLPASPDSGRGRSGRRVAIRRTSHEASCDEAFRCRCPVCSLI